jgi:hypothetical protein
MAEEERKPLTREEREKLQEERRKKQADRIERNINLAGQPDARVIRINSPGGATMANILRQFDAAYDEFKNRLGEPGSRGIPFEVGQPIAEQMTNILVQFSDLTATVCSKVNYQYRAPRELESEPRKAG